MTPDQIIILAAIQSLAFGLDPATWKAEWLRKLGSLPLTKAKPVDQSRVHVRAVHVASPRRRDDILWKTDVEQVLVELVSAGHLTDNGDGTVSLTGRPTT